ncbi:alpha/beta-hydrolase [Cadophora sp. DSE1049]|nr:alpha/beta-hydrolase [Cadophora sp. DSE1049]
MAERPSVVIIQGTVVGTTDFDLYPIPVQSFLGIPYALAPTGHRRFRPPMKVSASSDIFDASKQGPRAPGKPSLLVSDPIEEASEDCLIVNVFRQKPKDKTTKLPVCIYVHGGAFNRGSSSMHNTASMVGWSELPFIAVSFNYRLGALGFLPSRLSAREGLLNLGLKDQILLFEWVRDNIESFGGNPDDVTLMGFSAGAHSIGYHMLRSADQDNTLFHKVIMESGSPTARSIHAYDSPIHEEQFRQYVAEAGVSSDLPDSQIFDFLRDQPIHVLTKAQDVVFGHYNASLLWAFQPVIDGDVIPRHPSKMLQSDAWRKFPILTGFNGNEGSLFVDKMASKPEQFTEFFRKLLPELSQPDMSALDRLYPDPSSSQNQIYADSRLGLAVGGQYRRLEAAYGHYAYVAPVRQVAYLAKQSRPRAPPVYLYHWALASSVVNGASHGNNLNYDAFDRKICAISSSQKELSGYVHAYVTSFICTGNPNTATSRFQHRQQWEEYTIEDPKVMTFGDKNEELIGGGTGSLAKMTSDSWGKAECEFWWKISRSLLEIDSGV